MIFNLNKNKAASYDDLRVLEFLLDNGAEIDAADNEDKTPLMWGNFEEKNSLHH